MTTKQLQREVFTLRELIETKLGSSDARGQLIREIIETRLDGMDKALKLLQETTDRFPNRIDEKISALRDISLQKFEAMFNTNSEKFSGIQTQFRERDVRAEQSSKDSKIAVDAALQAAKEAVSEQNKSSERAIIKSETATVKQIDQLATLIQSMTKGFDDKISDVKDRMTRIEGKGEGGEKTKQTQQTSSNYLVAIIGLIIGAIGLLSRFVR